MYFKYSFGDDHSEPYSNADNITHVYANAGVYSYSVDAIAINRDSKAFHAAHRGQISVLGKVQSLFGLILSLVVCLCSASLWYFNESE